ncbi:MAG TPA: cell filamentation protein Fic, partial [Candidatus Moranbacteria bacterium]|nr:cell filamentation protein Fic [Candidatus Moranbacteria bacterium]
MNIDNQILNFLNYNPESSSNEVLQGIQEKKSIATIKRALSKLISENLIIAIGKGKSTKY